MRKRLAIALLTGFLGGVFAHYAFGLVAMILRHCGGMS